MNLIDNSFYPILKICNVKLSDKPSL